MRLFRSMLFAPGNHPRRVEKALTLDADAVILDLEDACPVAEKAASRPRVVEALQRPRECLGYVRVNAMSTEFAFEDIVAVVREGVDGVVLTKVEDANQLHTAAWLITQLERDRGLVPGSVDLIPVIETASGLSRVNDIARACPRVRRLALGAGDLTLDLGIHWSRDEDELLPFRSALVLASRAAAIEAPIDTPWLRLDDADGFQRSAQRTRDLGFQGKLCVHPNQVGVVNAAMSPGPDELAAATRIVAAFKKAEAEGSAAIQVDGQMVDYPVVARAQKTLDVAARMAHKSKGSEPVQSSQSTGA